jgi:hypothetical protein
MGRLKRRKAGGSSARSCCRPLLRGAIAEVTIHYQLKAVFQVYTRGVLRDRRAPACRHDRSLVLGLEERENNKVRYVWPAFAFLSVLRISGHLQADVLSFGSQRPENKVTSAKTAQTLSPFEPLSSRTARAAWVSAHKAGKNEITVGTIPREDIKSLYPRTTTSCRIGVRGHQ